MLHKKGVGQVIKTLEKVNAFVYKENKNKVTEELVMEMIYITLM